MKKFLIILACLLSGSLGVCAQETGAPATRDSLKANLAQASFGVRGNCGMCKRTIEEAATVDGVHSAVWDREKKNIDVTYDPATTTEAAIHEAIAKAGYDTDKVKAGESAYHGLHGCCQYDRDMKMGGDKKKKNKARKGNGCMNP